MDLAQLLVVGKSTHLVKSREKIWQLLKETLVMRYLKTNFGRPTHTLIGYQIA